MILNKGFEDWTFLMGRGGDTNGRGIP